MSGQEKATRQGGLKESNQHSKYSTAIDVLSSPVLQSLAVLVVLFALFALLVRECAI